MDFSNHPGSVLHRELGDFLHWVWQMSKIRQMVQLGLNWLWGEPKAAEKPRFPLGLSSHLGPVPRLCHGLSVLPCDGAYTGDHPYIHLRWLWPLVLRAQLPCPQRLRRQDGPYSFLHVCLVASDPMDCSPPGSSVHGILQSRVPEWAAMPSSRRSSQPRDWTRVSYISCIGRRVFTTGTPWEALSPSWAAAHGFPAWSRSGKGLPCHTGEGWICVVETCLRNSWV